MKKSTTTDGFFAEQKEKSKIKTMIVVDFFKAYFPIINYAFGGKVNKIYYIDLFCGPGQYEDGTPSTPKKLLDVVEHFQADDIRNKLQIVFNDHDTAIIKKLTECVTHHPVYEKLKFEPLIFNKDAATVDLSRFAQEQVPIFSFIDPWGYIDVSAEQIWTLVKNIGSDCVLFFNADRILQDVGKETQVEYFIQLFGSEFEQAQAVQKSSESQRLKTEKFLNLFSKNLYSTMNSQGFKYQLFVLPFCVEADDKEKTSHYIVFITKSHKAIQEMKKVMLKHSNSCSETLGFDSKDLFQISLLSRKDNMSKSIIDTIKALFSTYPAYYNVEFTVSSLMERLDKFSMSKTYQVFPYSENEVKEAVSELYSKGCIQLILKDKKKIIKPISSTRIFKILKTVMES